MSLHEYDNWAAVLREHPYLEEAVCLWDRDCGGDGRTHAVEPEKIFVLVNDKLYERGWGGDDVPRGTMAYAWTSGPSPMDWCQACRRWLEMPTGVGAARAARPDGHSFWDRCVPTGRTG